MFDTQGMMADSGANFTSLAQKFVWPLGIVLDKFDPAGQGGPIQEGIRSGIRAICVAPTAQQLESRTGAKE